jgi:Protein of unknown function (DUF1822)
MSQFPNQLLSSSLEEDNFQDAYIPAKLSTITSEVKINEVSMDAIIDWIREMYDFRVQVSYPHTIDREWITTIIEGFAIDIEGLRIVFFPCSSQDLSGFKIRREWVDLSNWIGDYYVPVEVIADENRLYLWGLISHEDLKDESSLDISSQVYELNGENMIADLSVLWTACEIKKNEHQSQIKLASERSLLPPLTLASMSMATVENAISQLIQLSPSESYLSPQSILKFEEWGAILNSPAYLQKYHTIANHLTSPFTQIQDVLKGSHHIWRELSDLLTGFSNPLYVMPIPMGTINPKVAELYNKQSAECKIEPPEGVDSPVQLLLYLVKHTNEPNLRWEAADFLWKLDPQAQALERPKIKDLGLLSQGHQLALMIAKIELAQGNYAVLARIYALEPKKYIPPNVKLSFLSKTNDIYGGTTSKADRQYPYLESYFIAEAGVLFNVRVSINNDMRNSVTEQLAL